MTDKTDSKERDLMDLVDAYAEARHIGGCHTYNAKTAEARNAVIAKLALSGFDAADMATASAQGFRDGVASLAASAGNEPVAPSGWREAIGEIRAGLEDSEPSGYDNSGYRAFAGTVLDAVEEALTELITHPLPQREW